MKALQKHLVALGMQASGLPPSEPARSNIAAKTERLPVGADATRYGDGRTLPGFDAYE